MGQITFKNGSIQFKGGTLTFLSYTPMVEPTVDAFWVYEGGKYKSKVSIRNNDTQIARMWYKIDNFPALGQYIDMDPLEIRTFTKEDTPFPPPYGTEIKGQAQATDPDPNNLRASSDTITDTASSTWGS